MASSAPASRPPSWCRRHFHPEDLDIRSLTVPIRDPSAAVSYNYDPPKVFLG